MAAWFAILLSLAVAGLWIARKPIAGSYIGDALRAANVPARYDIADLNFGRQRLTNIVIGDPASPDLVADWVETRTGFGLSGPYVTGVRAGHVRMRARLIDGRVSLGAIDRLLPAPSGKPLTLPALDVDVDDARIRLETPLGLVGLKVAGQGRLNDGFDGRVVAVSERLMAGECAVEGVRAAMHVRIAKAEPHVSGPVRVRSLACGTARVVQARMDLDAMMSAAFDRWRGSARIATGMAAATVRARSVGGTIEFQGDATGTRGKVDLSAADVRGARIAATQAVAKGEYEIGQTVEFAGQVRARGAAVSPAMLARDWAAASVGTPIAPLASQALGAARAAARSFAAAADIATTVRGGRGIVRISQLSIDAASGARLKMSGEADRTGLTYGWPLQGMRIDGVLAASGGGFPDVRLSLAQSAAGAPVRGRGRVARYAAGNASLQLDDIAFTATPRGMTRIATRAMLSGPLAGGRVDGLVLPIAATWDGRERLVVNTDCTPLGFDRLALSGLMVDRSRVRLCPVDGALVRLERGRLGGGARIGAMRLGGRLGTTPVTMAVADTQLRLGERGFALTGVEARIGMPDRVTRLGFAHVNGAIAADGLAGDYAGGAGQIGQVPLLMSDAAGGWTFARGALALTGALTVADAAQAARFRPLAVRAVTLGLRDGVIDAVGTLVEPTRGVKVADVTMNHALGSGRGRADLKVAGISFTDTFQPELLTPLTFGVIADVRGLVSGTGRIAWSPDGVASSGIFRTSATDLAAAFGPVTGLAGEIRFTDLLSLTSAPGQVVTVKSINPGIAVTDGVIRYQTLPDTRLRIENARWPFAGGQLTLDPTLLDFSESGSRRMTFHVAGAAADRFLQQFDFQNLNATGIFDGVLPMIFDASGGRIENGILQVRAGGGTLAYVGDLSQKNLGFWSNLAFQALRSLRYRSLGLTMNGALAGEMITEVRFAGVSQGTGAKSNFLIRRLQRLPFVFNIRIKAPFRGLLDSAQNFYDPRRLVQRNLQPLLDAQNKRQPAPPVKPPVQPDASKTMP